MKQIEMLDRTKKGNISLKEDNIKRIMYLILVNKISNVRYFLKNELNIEPTNFYEKIKLIEKSDSNFYKYYITRLEENKQIMKEKIKNMFLYIGTFMQYGVELEDGTFREFDIFDLYRLKNKFFDHLNRTELSLIIEELTKEGVFSTKVDLYSVRRLLSISFYDNPGSYSRMMHRDEILNSEEFGLTKKEAKRLLKFMEENKVPLNYENYLVGVEKIKKERENNNDLFKLDLDECIIDNSTENYKKVYDILIYIIDNKIINIKEYVEKELKINYYRFRKKVEMLKNIQPEFYEMFKNDYDNNYNEFKENAKVVMIYMAVLKEYGIELEDGTFRKFDLFDFYNLYNKYFEKLNKKDLLNIFEETFNDNQMNLLNLNLDNLRFVISSSVGCKLNSFESLDVQISEETIMKLDDDLDIIEKKNLINFMRDNNIPITLGNYTFGTKKMIGQRFTKNDMFNLDIYLETTKKKVKSR